MKLKGHARSRIARALGFARRSGSLASKGGYNRLLANEKEAVTTSSSGLHPYVFDTHQSRGGYNRFHMSAHGKAAAPCVRSPAQAGRAYRSLPAAMWNVHEFARVPWSEFNWRCPPIENFKGKLTDQASDRLYIRGVVLGIVPIVVGNKTFFHVAGGDMGPWLFEDADRTDVIVIRKVKP